MAAGPQRRERGQASTADHLLSDHEGHSASLQRRGGPRERPPGAAPTPAAQELDLSTRQSCGDRPTRARDRKDRGLGRRPGPPTGVGADTRPVHQGWRGPTRARESAPGRGAAGDSGPPDPAHTNIVGRAEATDHRSGPRRAREARGTGAPPGGRQAGGTRRTGGERAEEVRWPA